MALNTPKLITPVATAAYAWLSKPDEGQEYSDGKFKVTLLLDKADAETKTFLKKLEDASDEAAAEKFGGTPKKLNYCYKDGDEKDKEDFHGKWMLVAKTKFRPGMVDCSEPPVSLTEGSEPASGDLIRVSIALIAYEAGGRKGVAAQLRNVQLVEKRNLGNSTNDFDSIDGGFSTAAAAEIIDDDDF